MPYLLRRTGNGMPSELLSPKNDYVFKRLFGVQSRINPLRDFLQSVLDLPEEEFESLTVVDPYQAGDYFGDKAGILDVKINTRSKKVIDVEIQVEPFPDLGSRILSYNARMITEQIKAGDQYAKIQQAMSIVIVDHPLYEGVEEYHQRFRLRNDSGQLIFSDKLEIHTLELPKVPSKTDDSKLYQWLSFIRAKTEGEFKMLAEKNTAIAEAYDVLLELSSDERERLLAESREKWRRDVEARLADAMTKGLEKGLEKAAQNLLHKGGMSHAEIAALTDLPVETIKRLAAESAT